MHLEVVWCRTFSCCANRVHTQKKTMPLVPQDMYSDAWVSGLLVKTASWVLRNSSAVSGEETTMVGTWPNLMDIMGPYVLARAWREWCVLSSWSCFGWNTMQRLESKWMSQGVLQGWSMFQVTFFMLLICLMENRERCGYLYTNRVFIHWIMM